LHSRRSDHHHSFPGAGHPALRFCGRQRGYQIPGTRIPPAPSRDMRVDVVFTPAALGTGEVQGRTVFVVDILRATTTMCAALNHGAKAMIPVASTEEALRLAQTIGSADVLLAGEQDSVRIPGFHLGNSTMALSALAERREYV